MLRSWNGAVTERSPVSWSAVIRGFWKEHASCGKIQSITTAPWFSTFTQMPVVDRLTTFMVAAPCAFAVAVDSASKWMVPLFLGLTMLGVLKPATFTDGIFTRNE